MSSTLTILVSGMIAGDPGQGGATWAVLQYVLGLRRLGHEVYFIEPVKQLEPSKPYFESVVRDFRLNGRAALLLTGTRETFGISYDELRRVAQRADLLINISGMLTHEELTAPIPT